MINIDVEILMGIVYAIVIIVVYEMRNKKDTVIEWWRKDRDYNKIRNFIIGTAFVWIGAIFIGIVAYCLIIVLRLIISIGIYGTIVPLT